MIGVRKGMRIGMGFCTGRGCKIRMSTMYGKRINMRGKLDGPGWGVFGRGVSILDWTGLAGLGFLLYTFFSFFGMVVEVGFRLGLYIYILSFWWAREPYIKSSVVVTVVVVRMFGIFGITYCAGLCW